MFNPAKSDTEHNNMACVNWGGCDRNIENTMCKLGFFPKTIGSRLLRSCTRQRYIHITKLSIHRRLVHVVRDFRPWDVMTKVRYFLTVQIYDSRTLEVEHDLETCQRPWSTWIFTLWASQEPENWIWSLKNNVLSSLLPMDENPGRHEQVLPQWSPKSTSSDH